MLHLFPCQFCGRNKNIFPLLRDKPGATSHNKGSSEPSSLRSISRLTQRNERHVKWDLIGTQTWQQRESMFFGLPNCVHKASWLTVEQPEIVVGRLWPKELVPRGNCPSQLTQFPSNLTCARRSPSRNKPIGIKTDLEKEEERGRESGSHYSFIFDIWRWWMDAKMIYEVSDECGCDDHCVKWALSSAVLTNSPP